ncbi:MAG: ParB/Srx family N-terminal domain-containing protein [Verrucomicrobia bacterium]|nr:ParB/Srx family N-terminal domain-containing protein [Verrucomicrobiota bacterium]MCG2680603.1 ParB/Srx family N-terminal domain-containing protein [Kiritimatiellia bacterium]
MKKSQAPAIHCAYDKLIALDKLRPHPRNPNTHPKKQVDLLAEIIRRQGWRAPIVVSKRSGFIVAGHCRLQAAQAAGLKVAPVNFQDFPTDEAENEHLLADNKIAELAETDADLLTELLRSCPTVDAVLTGYDSEALDKLLAANPSADLAAAIRSETEHHVDDTLDPEAVIASLTGHVERLAQQHPERLRNALAVILPAGRGHTRDILILADPACADAAAELRRLAEAGNKSPVTALLAALLPLGGK